MDDRTMLGLDFVRTLRVEWDTEIPAPAGEWRVVYVREPAHVRLAEQLRAASSHIPSRYHVIDWLGRRLITWGWQLRMRNGSHRR